MLLQCYYRRFQPEQIKSIFLFSSSTTFLNDLNVEKRSIFQYTPADQSGLKFAVGPDTRKGCHYISASKTYMD